MSMIPKLILDKRRFKPLRKVYLQMFEGTFINDAAFTAYFGFKNLGFEIVKVEHGDFFNMEMEPDSMACGGVNFMRDAFRKFGARPPKPLDIPKVLEPFAQRAIGHTTLVELMDSDPKFPIFVKPDENTKVFDGMVITNMNDLSLLQHYSGLEIPIMTSEVLRIISEHRAFVVDGELIDARKYKGRFGTHPDLDTINACIAAWDDQPVAYSLDMGVTDDGKTVLIEANDAYSLGTYGLDPYSYAKMLILRWKEITTRVEVAS